jgi:hypothetical protein
MTRLWILPALLAVAIAAACSSQPDALSIPEGSEVTLEKRDGVKVAGKLVEVQPQVVVVEGRDGARTRVPRTEIASVRAIAPQPEAAPQPPAAPAAPNLDDAAAARTESRPAARTDKPNSSSPASARAVPEYREVTLPAGTVLPVELRTTVGSASSKVEDPVRGTVRRPVTIDGVEAIPAGSTVAGTVTEAARSGRVKGLARVAFRFSSLNVAGDAERVTIRTSSIAREAQATKKQDAAKIGGGAAAGAVIGGIIGGGDGAAKGAAIGGGAGTGVVLSTRGKEITVPAGTAVSVKLLEPATVRVRVR